MGFFEQIRGSSDKKHGFIACVLHIHVDSDPEMSGNDEIILYAHTLVGYLITRRFISGHYAMVLERKLLQAGYS